MCMRNSANNYGLLYKTLYVQSSKIYVCADKNREKATTALRKHFSIIYLDSFSHGGYSCIQMGNILAQSPVMTRQAQCPKGGDVLLSLKTYLNPQLWENSL